ncbi:MAG: N-6 DNA methylase [Haloechinothrix sp.]
MAEHARVTAADIARLAGVGRAAVSNWRRRHPDFPRPVAGTESSPRFKLDQVERWLRDQGKLEQIDAVDALWPALDFGRADLGLLATWVRYLHGGDTANGVSREHRKLLDEVADESRGELAERLCSRFLASGQRAPHVTPPALAELMVEIADATGTVFDPACGAGNLLRAAAQRGARELAGQELDTSIATLARARLEHDAPTMRIEAGDALRADAFPDLRADTVLCDPPFGYRDWGHEDLGVDARWEYGFPVKGEPELAWLQHCIAHAKSGGTVVMVLPASVAFRRSGRSIRQALLRRGALRAVIALPPGVLMSTGIPIHLWVLRNPERAGADPVLLVDASHLRPERRGRVDWQTLHSAVLDPWRQFAAKGVVAEVPGQQRTIDAIDLLDEDVDLTPARHLPLPAPDVDTDAVAAECAELAKRLKTLAGEFPRVRGRDGELPRATITINELARAGALVLRQHMGRLDITDEPGADGPLVLTGRDLATGAAPTMRVAAPPTAEVIELRPGDVVAPSVAAGGGRQVARVIDSGGVVLGPNVQLIRVDPDRLDAEFLAGQLRASRAAQASSQTASGVHRLDIRRVEVPVLDVAEQRGRGERFRRLHELETALRVASEDGVRLARLLTDGLAEGLLDFPLITKRG